MSTYFTRIAINPRRRGSHRVLGSPHFMHGAVGSCFAPTAPPERPLWRVDRTTQGVFLYLVSDVAPDPTSFVEEYGWPLAGGWETRDYAVVLDAVRNGRQFAFRLTANPVHNVRMPGRSGEPEPQRTTRLSHVTATQQLKWFTERAQGWGISVGDDDAPSVEIVERAVLTFGRQGRKVTIGTAVFEGELTVTDEGELRRRLVTGFGHAKAYGCGLLTLAPSDSHRP
ncbi:type I-E CRISPR-associated protein Cas6/Cse3/CasE [Miniimonas arenae]|uniref:Type I-E CRISPR-associated protein Cas6/Cse3/CasE n=1 Tax=Miniimonas arenae TaxID=676201 RepID=A0A5C5BAY3_9MICO|nr:type I-E CRISPR-associated protein Cas6/Cse3/CasE [Miniimonas arenae]TNU73347.1 type I-E CRISPR-associated protein Cas6/Cse3/CasE [Miniimonas arenae]